MPRDFYAGIWSLLQHCRGLVIGDKLERRNRLNSRLILEKTAGEKNFATLVEHLLSRIQAPEYRQLCTECLLSLMAFVEANPEVHFDDDLALDVVIGHAVRVGWQQTHPSQTAASYNQYKDRAWGQFYAASPDCCRWQVAALRELAEQEGLVDQRPDDQIGANRGAPSGCSTACSIRSASLSAREAWRPSTAGVSGRARTEGNAQARQQRFDRRGAHLLNEAVVAISSSP